MVMIMQLSEADLMKVSGGQTSQRPFEDFWEIKGGATGTPVTINLGTSGGGRVNLGPKVDVVPVNRYNPPKGSKKGGGR